MLNITQDTIVYGIIYISNSFLKYLLKCLLVSIILFTFVTLLYISLVYFVLIKLKFFRELLKEFGLPIPIQYKDIDKDS